MANLMLSCVLAALPPLLCHAVLFPPRFGQCPNECSQLECGSPTWLDLWKPIPEVLAQHPNIDGYCYYSQFGAWWLADVPRTMKSRNLSGLLASERALDYSEVGELITLSYDNVSLTTHDMVVYDGSRYDVPYCHGLGWFRGQLDTPPVDDFDAWEALSKQECKKLQELQDYTRGQMTLDYHLENRELHVSDFRAHVYVKCLMGSVSTEIMHCNLGMGCLLKGNYIGHGSECE
eukprot:CAMPEP_0171090350 /NCGR_PEP_ID=MMETSP0766_2-20121228/30521_1 /TAXON_ID=439317 /ORGANISM="Gambierdiscus australes, Strain CAWD 149" /LENGTH=232 /DNA_ID=CAMNT_0011548331 /DNA_START=50 /DNA_END=748 /DNA_ORIENTATION=+